MAHTPGNISFAGNFSRGLPFSKTVISGLLTAIDSLITFTSGIIIFSLYVGWDDFNRPLYFTTITTITMALPISFFSAKLYRLDEHFSPRYQSIGIFSLITLIFLLLDASIFALKISSEFSRVWAFSWYFSVLVFIMSTHYIAYFLVRSSALAGHLTRNVVIVGFDDRVELLIRHMNKKKYPWVQFVGIFDDRQNRIRPHQILKRIGNLDSLVKFARNNRCDDVLIAIPWAAEKRISDIIKKLRSLPVRIQLCPEKIYYDFPNGYCSDYFGLPVFTISEKPLANWKYFLKSIEDFVLAVMLLPLLLPLMACIALLIKLDSKGPVFFRQKRYGFNNRIIGIFKFRTMYTEHEDKNAVKLTGKNDPRVTRIGSILRHTSLDEIPQILNVLRGEMSIIGPRPHATLASAAGKLYQDAVPGYSIRHKIKPGITGWAQVNGWRGETDTIEKITERVRCDIFYIEHWSLKLDLLILFKTLAVVISGKNAY